MNFGAMEAQRQDTADAILAKFGASIEEAEQSVAARASDPALKKLMAARMALEYAVLATAREKSVATQTVAEVLKSASIAQQAQMIKDGAAALGRAYRVEPQVLANVFAGRVNEVEMPRGLESTPEIDKMVDACRGLVTGIVRDEYANRGRIAGTGRGDSFLALQSDGIVAPAKTELAARLAFMEAAIDASVIKGGISQENAGMLKDRIEARVFQPRPPHALEFSREFTAFFAHRGKGLRIEAMTEVRGVTQSLTVQQIAAKLQALLPPASRGDRPPDHRTHQPMER